MNLSLLKQEPKDNNHVLAVALIISTHDEFNRSVIKYLWQNNVETMLTSSLSEAQKMVVQFLPDFVFVPYDHTDFQSVSNFINKFRQLKTIEFISYAEKEISTAIARIAQFQIKKAIHPPLSGESFFSQIKIVIQQTPNWESVRNQKNNLIHSLNKQKKINLTDLLSVCQLSFKKIAKSDKKKPLENLKTVTTLVGGVLCYSNQCTYVLGAQGSEVDSEMLFFNNFKGYFLDFAREKGYKISDFKFQQIRIRKTDFLHFLQTSPFTYQSTLHENKETAISFFELPTENFNFITQIEKGMVRINLSQIEQDKPSPVSFYIYSDTTFRYTLVLKKEKSLNKIEYNRLVEKKITHLFFHQDEIQDLIGYYLKSFIDEKIENYHAETRNRELSDKQRMSVELEMAKTIQDALFPTPFFDNPYLKVKGSYRNSSECGGDWWYYSLVEDKAYFFIGDATGHGVSAALICSAAKASASLLIYFPQLPLSGLMSILNHSIYGTSQGKILMTFCISCLNLRTGEVSICNASHEVPLVFPSKTKLKKSDILPLLAPSGPRLGERSKSNYTEETFRIQPTDRLFFYTDGVTEAENLKGEQWGEQKMIRSLLKAFQENTGIDQPFLQLANDLDRFRENAPLVDDLTYFMVDFKQLKTEP